MIKKIINVVDKILLSRLLPFVLLSAIAVCSSAALRAAEPQHSRCANPATGLEAPFELQSNMQLAQQYLDAGLTAQAIPCLENVHQLDRDALDTVYNLGRAYLDTGNVDAARTLTESQLRTGDNPRLRNLLGAIDTRQLQFREAAAQYQSAAQQDPSEQNIFDFGTSLLRFAGRSAEQIFRYGISKYPGSVRLHLGLAYALWAQGQDPQAAQEMCAGARLDPSDPRPFDMLGITEEIETSLEPEITERLAGLVRLYPRNGKLLFYYAMALSGVWSGQDLSHLDPVIPMLERSIVLDPKVAGPHVYLARRAQEKAQNAEALNHYRQAAALSPDDDQIAYRLAFAYKNAGDKAMFQEELLRFRALHEKSNQSSSQAAEQLQRIDSAR